MYHDTVPTSIKVIEVSRRLVQLQDLLGGAQNDIRHTTMDQVNDGQYECKPVSVMGVASI